ncbi:MAG: hypothetical protein ACLR7U_08300 [Ruthenibacterium lactatiformans]
MWDFLQNLLTALAHRNGACRVGGGAHPKHKSRIKPWSAAKMLPRAKIIDLGLHYIEAGEFCHMVWKR